MKKLYTIDLIKDSGKDKKIYIPKPYQPSSFSWSMLGCCKFKTNQIQRALEWTWTKKATFDI